MIASTGKDEATGNLVTKQYRVKGPVMLMLTTTAIDVDEELLNRCLVLTINESREQTRQIHAMQRAKQTLEGLLADAERQHIVELHRNAQRLLKPVHELQMPLLDRQDPHYMRCPDYGRVWGRSAAWLAGTQLAGAVARVRGGVPTRLGTYSYDLFADTPVYKPSGFPASSVTLGFQVTGLFQDGQPCRKKQRKRGHRPLPRRRCRWSITGDTKQGRGLHGRSILPGTWTGRPMLGWMRRHTTAEKQKGLHAKTL